MADTRTPIAETFAVEQGSLVRRVMPRRGKPYEHRCTLATFTEVAHRVDEAGEGGVVLDEIAEAAGLPFTQVAVALAFLKERGCIVPVHGRRHVAASNSCHLDAMVEWHALREQGPAPDAQAGPPRRRLGGCRGVVRGEPRVVGAPRSMTPCGGGFGWCC